MTTTLLPGRLQQDKLLVKVAGTTTPLAVFSAVLSEGDSNPSGPWYVSIPASGVSQLLIQPPTSDAPVVIGVSR